jgi:hypothetical protein
MRDFVNFCLENNLVDVSEDGTVTWKEEAIKDNKCGSYKNKFGSGRNQRQDPSDDYKDYCHHMGTVWPFKIVVNGKNQKQAAGVAK